MSAEYYNAKQAIEILNMTTTTFYRKVREGEIPSKGKRPNIQFPKVAIDALAELAKEGQEDKNTLHFCVSTIADAWTKQEITAQPYGEDDAVPFKTVLAWRKRNDEISMNVKRGDNLLGWTTFLPLDENIIMELINDRMREKDIPVQAIKKWDYPQLSVYIPIIEVVPTDDLEKDKEVGAFLIRKTIKWAVSLMVQHDIKNWYAIGTTPEGQRLLESLGFTLLTNREEGKRKSYMLGSGMQHVRLLSQFFRSVEEPENMIPLN